MHQLRTTRGRLLERFVTVSYINSKLPRMNVGGRNLSGSTLSKEYLTISNVSPGLKLRAFESRATEHPVIVSCLCTSRATIGAYFCISLGDSSLSQQPRRGDSQLSRATAHFNDFFVEKKNTREQHARLYRSSCHFSGQLNWTSLENDAYECVNAIWKYYDDIYSRGRLKFRGGRCVAMQYENYIVCSDPQQILVPTLLLSS